ncbi:hypothetical protein E8E11_009669 [Didymella keratinophila]|nr:hypothetical protein E8E11_009669 [Didymella keratinophila]
MPPKKKQRTSENSAAATQEHEIEQQEEQSELESSNAQDVIEIESGDDDESSDEGSPLRDTKNIPDHEYIGMHRPYFDYEAENRTLGKESKMRTSTTDHKWVIMWEGYKMFMDYRRRSNYCCPDRFGMYIYNDFEGWGYQELIENFIVEFDASLKKSGDDALKYTWAIISALALWINEVDQGPLMDNEDGENTEAVIGLIGQALIRGLAALDSADQLKPDSDFPDIPIVITSLLQFSHGLEDYGIEGGDKWRPHAAAYFNKSKFAPEKGISNTKDILETAKGGSEAKLPKKDAKDPWGWDKTLKAYKKQHGTGKGRGQIGGYKYDITRMSRKERASHAFDKKDPLADVSDKDLKERVIDFV